MRQVFVAGAAAVPDYNGADLSSAAAFIGSWTPNGPPEHHEPSASVQGRGRAGSGKIRITEEDRCLLIVANAEKSEFLCGQVIERVENK